MILIKLTEAISGFHLSLPATTSDLGLRASGYPSLGSTLKDDCRWPLGAPAGKGSRILLGM